MTAFEYTACIGPLRTSRRIYRIQKACRLLLLLVVVSLLLFARREGLLHLLIRKRQHLQPTTVESQTTPVVNVPHAHDDDPSSHVTPTIRSRGVGVSSSCNRKYDDSSLARVSSRGLRLFIAALLHNNEDVVDVWADEVLRLARLFPGSFVSVLESGSESRRPFPYFTPSHLQVYFMLCQQKLRGAILERAGLCCFLKNFKNPVFVPFQARTTRRNG